MQVRGLRFAFNVFLHFKHSGGPFRTRSGDRLCENCFNSQNVVTATHQPRSVGVTVSAGEVSELSSRGGDASGHVAPVAVPPQATSFASSSHLPQKKNPDSVVESAATSLTAYSSARAINRPPDAPDAGALDPPIQRLFDDYFTSFMHGLLQHNNLDPGLWLQAAVQLCQSCVLQLSIDALSKDGCCSTVSELCFAAFHRRAEQGRDQDGHQALRSRQEHSWKCAVVFGELSRSVSHPAITYPVTFNHAHLTLQH
jgi:hypothetical protein